MAMNRLISTNLAAIATFENERRKERQRQGIQAAKKNGKYFVPYDMQLSHGLEILTKYLIVFFKKTTRIFIKFNISIYFENLSR